MSDTPLDNQSLKPAACFANNLAAKAAGHTTTVMLGNPVAGQVVERAVTAVTRDLSTEEQVFVASGAAVGAVTGLKVAVAAKTGVTAGTALVVAGTGGAALIALGVIGLFAVIFSDD